MLVQEINYVQMGEDLVIFTKVNNILSFKFMFLRTYNHELSIDCIIFSKNLTIYLL